MDVFAHVKPAQAGSVYQGQTGVVPIATLAFQLFQRGRGGGAGRLVGAYTTVQRRARVARYLELRQRRVWHKKIKYDCRKRLASGRVRIKGRFVKDDGEDAAAGGEEEEDVEDVEGEEGDGAEEEEMEEA